MKILVTGGAGFIGSHLVDALLAAGHQVAVVDNLSTGVKHNLNPAATFHELGIQDPALAEIFKAEKPAVVFHEAAQIDVRKSVANPVWDAEQNILGSINLLENCKQYGVTRVIFASTGGAIYGDTDQIPTAEDQPTAPISPYGIAKLTIEKYLNYYQQVFGLAYVVLRYANVYGPRQNAKGEAGVVSIFIDQLFSGQTPTIYGDGRQTRDYVYVGDIVAANLLALTTAPGTIYNIGTGIETTVNQLAAIISSAAGQTTTFNYASARPGEQQRSCLNWTKAKKILAWQPTMPLKEGIEKTVVWFKDHAES